MKSKLIKLYQLGNESSDAAYEAYVDELVSPAYTYSDAASSTTASPEVGSAPMKANRRALRAAMPDLSVSVSVDDVICDEAARAVALRWAASGTFLHDLGPVRATGRAVRYAGTFHARFDAAGRLSAGHGAWDLFSFLAQLGLVDEAVNPFRAAPQSVPPITITAAAAAVAVAAAKPTPPLTPTKRLSTSYASPASSSPAAAPSAFTAAVATLLATRNAWMIVSTEFDTLHHGTADDPLAAAAALLRDDDVGVVLINHGTAGRAATRLLRIIWCGAQASRAQRSALSHCRQRLDGAVSVFTVNFNAYSSDDLADIQNKL